MKSQNIPPECLFLNKGFETQKVANIIFDIQLHFLVYF